MSTTTRVCKVCREKINITLTNLNSGDFVKYKNSYCHTDCFVEQLKENINKQNKFSAKWQGVLDNLDTYKSDARDAVKTTFYKDALNEYLIKYYDIGALSKRFWQLIAGIQVGKYKGKRCRPVKLEILFDMWKDYQKELDKTNAWNKHHGKEIEGEARANYDLAILMSNYVKYAKAKDKAKKELKEKQDTKTKSESINYSKIKAVETKDGLGDINDLLDDLI